MNIKACTLKDTQLLLERKKVHDDWPYCDIMGADKLSNNNFHKMITI